MLKDLLFAWRLTYRTPVLSVGAILILGAGVGITTALFSVLHAVLLKPLPYPESANLVIVAVYRASPDAPGARPSHLLAGDEVQEVQSLSSVFDSTAWFELWTTNPAARQRLMNASASERLRGALVTPSFFDVLGVEPIVGRPLRPDDGPDAVVISHGLWRRQFASDTHVVGMPLQLDEVT
jgi:hypothetical protein